jgi:2'-5' RNA ligase
MRLFLAVNPPADFRHQIWMECASLRDASPGISWVVEPRIHLTLKFLGEQPDSAIGPLTQLIEGVAAMHAPPLIQVGGIGAFPNLRRPRVVWIGVEPEPKLELLHHDLELACNRIGYEIEGKPFRPHLTLGRVRESLSAVDRRAMRACAAKVRFSNMFTASSVDLMRSGGSPGSGYVTLATARMGAA